ncbi:ATPase, T2SS/T4P/T4SS family [Acetobacterium woodii]|uniref:Type II secretion system protein E n=1 Tax=Acetobacterium woodii (strain ATCC 29683 / DSM 1030 / JCM 2381 / KCTC 1655 / WB1) TaxID=931626 RepID=H6LDE7_ACEWD|nr:ATPase, T2SS/T4P/T4SS family [Acetobacterium woodii]AFA47919.1 type II secretion system protein E [Acetobacterium woodii DSM 1030]
MNLKINRELEEIVNRIQMEINATNHQAISGKHKNEELIINTIKKYITDHNTVVEGYTSRELTNRIFNAMARYDILTPLLENFEGTIEEININRWDDVKVHYQNGEVLWTKETFFSPKFAKDTIVRLLAEQSEETLSEANSVVSGSLGTNIRINAACYPTLDEDAGVQASIRIINPNKLGRDDLINNGTLTEEIFDFINLCKNYGASIIVAGATDAGKTTFMSSALADTPDHKRIVTIEEGIREFDLIKRDEAGRVINNVVHLKTDKNHSQIDLLKFSLMCNPDIISVAEMKSKEAYAAQEAARTGHMVMSTTHANNCRAAYTRMMTLCKMTSSIDDKMLYSLIAEAFPIAIFCKRLDDFNRKVMEVTECFEDENGKIDFNTLYSYEIDASVRLSDAKYKIDGHFVKNGIISSRFQNWLRSSGVPMNEIKRFLVLEGSDQK